MTVLTILPDDFRLAEVELEEAYKEIRHTQQRMEKAMAELESKWEGASRQTFYKNYKDLGRIMGGMGILIKEISRELNAMAEEFTKADRIKP